MGKELGPWNSDVQEDPTEAEDFELSDSEGVVPPEEAISPPLAEDASSP